MEQEMQAKGDVIMTVQGPPPSYQEPKNKAKPYLLAIVAVSLVTLLLVSFGMFYLIFKEQSPAVINNVTTDDDEPVVIIRDVSFQMADGVPRNEKMMAEGNKLTIDNRGDGYTVVFDFDKNLAVFKNRTTFSCLFTRLDDLPVDMNMDNLSAILPVYFNDSMTASDKPMNYSSAIMFSNQFEQIPTGFLELTSTEQCADGSSFWIEPMKGQRTRNTRQTAARAPVVVAEKEPVLCEFIVIFTECETYFLKSIG